MEERQEIRIVEPAFPDVVSALEAGVKIQPYREVAETAITVFCGGCDHLEANNVCGVVGENDQGRYVDRGWCGWASVGGVSGEMTDEGFYLWGSETPIKPAAK